MKSVLKVGGSLLNYPKDLKKLCAKLSEIRKDEGLIIIPGGGEFADIVRKYYKKLKLSETNAHRMAVYSMDQFGLILNNLMGDSSKLIYDVNEVNNCLKEEKIGIFQISFIDRQINIQPKSWNVTSDSIAAIITNRIDYNRLLLVKVVDGLFELESEKLIEKIFTKDIESKTKKGVIDHYFNKVILTNQKKCYIVNGLFPNRIIDIIRGNPTVCTEIIYN